MSRKRLLSAQQRRFEAFARADATGKIREADAEIAFGVLIDKCWI